MGPAIAPNRYHVKYEPPIRIKEKASTEKLLDKSKNAIETLLRTMDRASGYDLLDLSPNLPRRRPITTEPA
jgi:hypothetical protein